MCGGLKIPLLRAQHTSSSSSGLLMILAAGRGVAHRPFGIDLEDCPIVVAAVACALEQPTPHVRFPEGLRREHPVQKRIALVVVAISVNLDVTAARRNSLDLLHRLHASIVSEIVDDIDAKRRGEAAIREW